ncbi:MAG: DNA-formamidopyrimidine glycosylase [Candidatus Moraniibacteriota bacterium]
MPELPEVQTVVNQLRKKTVGHTVVGFWTNTPKRVKVSVAKLKKAILGAKIIGTRRFGKHIVIDLDNDQSILIHLKMTGHLLVKTPQNREGEAFTEDKMNGYIRHAFLLDRETRIDFSDMRKFAWIDLSRSDEISKQAHIEKLGPDALAKDFTLENFNEILKKYLKRLISVLLLDQEKIAGIGNIYRSEALYRAGILPMRRTGRLTKKEREKLYLAIREVLREAVRLRGTSDGDFRDTDGREGSFQKTLFVYGRTGKPCKRCDTIVMRKKIGQRSVFFCPKCQH